MLLTNAGIDDRLPPWIREELEAQLREQGLLQQDEEAGRRAARLRERPADAAIPIPLAAQETMNVDGVEYQDVVLAWELEEPEYDESVEYLPMIGRPVECTWWPFKPKGAETGTRYRVGPKAWDAMLDAGTYCLRCRGRYLEPDPVDGCHRCHLSQLHRHRALAYLERVASVMAGEGIVHVEGQNRAQRRAQQKAHRRAVAGGLVTPRQRLVLPEGA